MTENEIDTAMLEYLRRQPGQGLSDGVLSHRLGISDIDAARSSGRLEKAGTAERYSKRVGEPIFGYSFIQFTRVPKKESA